MESKLKDASGLVHAKEIVKRNGIDAIIYIANGGSILKEHLCFRKRFKAYDIWGGSGGRRSRERRSAMWCGVAGL